MSTPRVLLCVKCEQRYFDNTRDGLKALQEHGAAKHGTGTPGYVLVPRADAKDTVKE